MIPLPPGLAGVAEAQVRGAGRVPPQDLTAEMSVLGALLLDPDAIAMVRDLLEPGDFYAEKHANIYRAAVMLADRGEPIDEVTLRSQLERTGMLPRSGGVEYLTDLLTVVPTAASIRYYADIVIEHAMRRGLISVGTEVATLGYNSALPAQEAIDRAEQRIFGIADQRNTSEATHIAQAVTETWDHLEKLLNQRSFISGVPTNFKKLDSLTQGLQDGELIILAARPSVGKTSFALNIARNAAVLGKKRVVVYSMEMTRESLVQRLICSEASVDAWLLKTGQADATAFQRVAQAMDRLSSADIWIDDTPAVTIESLRARVRRMKAQHDVSLVVIDYLQLMHGGRRQESRVQEVSDISSGLKSIAKELKIPVLALSQLSRESERRENRKPQLSDLRDSGCLAGETGVLLANTGAYVPIQTLVGRADCEVMALDEASGRLEPRRVLAAFSTGVRAVHRLTTASGRSIRATGNHRFLTTQGWRRLDALAVGEHLAVPAPTAAAGGRVGTGTRVHPGGGGGLAVAQAMTAVAEAVVNDAAGSAATADVRWDPIVSITPDAETETFDLTVEELHNFVAEDIVVHNSIEQDADVVLFLYRPGLHDENVDKSVTKLMVAKNRNGPIDDIDLHFVASQTTFREPYLGPADG